MDIVAIFLILALLILVGAYLYAPFLRGYGRRVTQEERELSALLAERERVFTALHDLDFDFRLGKIPEGDYPAQRTSLLQKRRGYFTKARRLERGASTRGGADRRKETYRRPNRSDDLEAARGTHKSIRRFLPKVRQAGAGNRPVLLVVREGVEIIKIDEIRDTRYKRQQL